MIVLDEQLLGLGIEAAIGRWYRGSVRFITDLRPRTVIKDEVIPTLLQQQHQATFVTINERDFWRRIPASDQYCVVCFTLSDTQAREIATALRELFRRPELSTKRRRMGKVARVSGREISFYGVGSAEVETLSR